MACNCLFHEYSSSTHDLHLGQLNTRQLLNLFHLQTTLTYPGYLANGLRALPGEMGERIIGIVQHYIRRSPTCCVWYLWIFLADYHAMVV
jgi:hypothetical protein